MQLLLTTPSSSFLPIRATKRKASYLLPPPTLSIRAGFQDISHNQVLVTATAASVLGHLLKPFASALQGKGFNWRLVLRSGGMPSVHSALVTASCTALALERGLSDSVFGISVVYAGIVMYDAQGVRKAVGKQAEVINTMLLTTVRDISTSRDKTASADGSETHKDPTAYSFEAELESMVRSRKGATTDTFNDIEERSSTLPTGRQSDIFQRTTPGLVTNVDQTNTGNGSFNRYQDFFKVANNFPSMMNVQELGILNGWQHVPLKESVGHTKTEVLVGGLWGISIALALASLIQSAPR